MIKSEEDGALAYVALSVGPLGKEVSTMVTHLSAIGHFHRIRTGPNPLTKMARVQLTIKGLRRSSGPEKRKPPFSTEDIRAIKGLLNLKELCQFLIWAASLLGRFFMLRMSEFLATESKYKPQGRHPIRMNDVAPMCKGAPTHWGEHVGEICVHISGPKTDWINQGCVRSRAKLRQTSPNADICAVRAFLMLFKGFPAKFSRNPEVPVAVWRSGAHQAVGGNRVVASGGGKGGKGHATTRYTRSARAARLPSTGPSGT